MPLVEAFFVTCYGIRYVDNFLNLMKKHTWKIIFAVVVVVMGGSIAYSQYASNAANEGVELTQHVKGNTESTVVLTEYADFQCPACAQFHPVIQMLNEEYGDSLAIEFKHFPLTTIHPYALPAAKAAEAAGVQGKFFEMHDKLFENQSSWSQSATPQAFFNQYAADIGLDVALFRKHMSASVIEDKIKGEAQEAVAQGFTGTPAFLLNGERLTFGTFDEFIAQIEAALGIVATTSEATVEEGARVQFGLPGA